MVQSVSHFIFYLLGLVAHESEQVALMALSRLEGLLQEHWHQIHQKFVMHADTVTPTIVEILKVLLMHSLVDS